MTCEHLSRVLALCAVLLGAMTTTTTSIGARDFHEKVALMLKEDTENPKCFAESKKDLTCFWEEAEGLAGPVDQYSFTYSYQNEDSQRCPLRAVPSAGGKTLFVCHLNPIQLFVLMDIRVLREGALIHNRSLFIEFTFLLDPPANVTVNTTGKQGQLRVAWLPPPLRHMEDSMLYAVSYATGHRGQVQVEEVMSSELILTNLQPGSRYKVQVRVKPDGISYSGYWSSWSEPVFIDTLPGEFDPLIMSLTLIISFILMVLSLTILLSHRRFLTKKIWPMIPTPDGKFQDLFTVHGGDFQEWLGHTNGGLWTPPAFSCSEERPSPLQVLSELSPSPPSPPPPPRAPGASPADRQEDVDVERPDERESSEGGATPHDRWLMERLRALHQAPAPCSQSSLLESQDTYVTLSNHNHGEAEPLDDILEETSPLEMLFASRKTALCSESHSDLGSAQQSSGSGALSSQSSFEYPNHSWAPKGLGYPYMAVADSGVSMDYSPMSRGDDVGKVVVYANDIPSHRRPFLPRRHPVLEDG